MIFKLGFTSGQINLDKKVTESDSSKSHFAVEFLWRVLHCATSERKYGEIYL